MIYKSFFPQRAEWPLVSKLHCLYPQMTMCFEIFLCQHVILNMNATGQTMMDRVMEGPELFSETWNPRKHVFVHSGHLS